MRSLHSAAGGAARVRVAEQLGRWHGRVADRHWVPLLALPRLPSGLRQGMGWAPTVQLPTWLGSSAG